MPKGPTEPLSRRTFIQKNLCVGALLLARPGWSFGQSPAIVRVSLGNDLGYHGQVVAQRYLADLARAMGEAARILDPIEAVAPNHRSGLELEIVISSFWRIGRGFSVRLDEHWPHSSDQWLGILNEAPLCIGVNRFMPRTWQDLMQSGGLGQRAVRCGIPSGDPVIHKLAQGLLAKAGLTADRYVQFKEGHQMLSALVGSKLDLALAPLHAADFVGRPGGYGDILKFHRRGELTWLAVAENQGLAAHPEIPTLNQILGLTGHEAVMTTRVGYNGLGDPELIQKLQLATSKFFHR